jgi:hypothetical protein
MQEHERDHIRRPGRKLDEIIIWEFEMAWAGFNWMEIGSGDGPLCTHNEIS